ncbi:hypothetical protein Tco_1171973, partial [Tanacetum coccineum]
MKESLDRNEESVKVNGPGSIDVDQSQDSLSFEVNEQVMVNEDIIDQSVKDDNVEKENGVISVSDDSNEKKSSDREDEVLYDDIDDDKLTDDVNKPHKNNEVQNKSRSYDDATGENVIDFERKLLEVPTEIDDNGVEVVVFDEVMVEEGSKIWEKTVCAYFVKYGMP